MVETVQADFFGKPKILWYCIHCNYVGYEFVQEGEHEMCPKCGWVVYNDSEVKKHFLNSNIYRKLKQKYRRIHKLPQNGWV